MKPTQRRISVGVLSLLALVVPTSAWAQIPVNCGDTLNITGGQYKLYADLNCPGDGVTVAAHNVHLNLAGYSITGPGRASGATGVIVLAFTRVHVQGGTIRDFSVGLDMIDASESHVNGMTFDGNIVGLRLLRSNDNKINGNLATANTARAIDLSFSHRNRVHSNVMTFNFNSLILRASNNNVVTSNVATNYVGDPLDTCGCSAIVLVLADRNTVRGNTANSHEVGIVVQGGQDNLIQGNTINDNLFAGIATGFTLPVGPGTRIQGNTALNNTYDGPFPSWLPAGFVPKDMMDFDLLRSGVSQVQWKSNTFVTDSEGDGPGAGWIR